MSNYTLNFILEILKKIELDNHYAELCNTYSDFNKRKNLTKIEVESVIKTFDSSYKYISKDKTFLKELFIEGFTVRFFLGFKNGIIGFGYLVWKEGGNNNYHKGNLNTLSQLIDGKFEERVKNNFPIATSLDDLEKILEKIFLLFDSFEQVFRNTKDI